jgi:hypothetical protein
VDSEPKDPFSSLAASAAICHEFHESLLQAGFGEWQALYLTGQFIIGQCPRGS